ncbi:7-cyano-7-deazaguanine synthase QueC [Bacteroidota bacterium]
MKAKKTNIIVLHSGGLDSTVCLLQAIEQGKNVISLGIDYDQRHKIENQYAYAQCRILDIDRKVIKVDWEKSTEIIPKGRSINEIGKDISPAFLEGRNIVFLSLACAEAAGLNAKEVWIGVNSIDFSGYPDCRPEFIDSFREMLKYGYPNGPEIITSLTNKTKPEIAQEAYRLGIRKGGTWSCYSPKISENGIHHCNECDACILHNYAWDNVDFEGARIDNKFSNLNIK